MFHKPASGNKPGGDSEAVLDNFLNYFLHNILFLYYAMKEEEYHFKSIGGAGK